MNSTQQPSPCQHFKVDPEIQHRQHLQRPTVVRPIRHEVIRPDVMAVQGSKPDA